MWALGFWTALQDRKDAFESKHILLSFLCVFFFRSCSHNRGPSYCGVPHSAAAAIRLENNHQCHFHATFFKRQFSFFLSFFFLVFKQRPRAKEIRWGHGYLQGYKVCVGKWKL